MTYEIKQTEDGHFAVMEMWPVEIARFGSETHARMFVKRVLLSEPPRLPDPAAEDLSENMMTPVSEPAERRFDAKASLRGFAREVMQEVEARHGEPLPEPPPADGGPSEDWETALRRVAAGEGCKAVADAMGLPFGILRARWAARSKAAASHATERAAEPEIVENGHDTRSAPLPAVVPVRQKPVVAGKLPGQVLTLPDETEDVRGRPDLVARRDAIWTDEIDMALIEAVDDDAKLWMIAQKTGASIERCRRRQQSLLDGIAREIGR